MEIKAKKVELIELFYDLIYVYAISKLTELIVESANNVIQINVFFSYIVTSFVILQAWLYFTNYVNRYGKWKWYDYLIICINMIAVIYMANTISPEWNEMYLTFNISMLVMLLTVVTLYVIQAFKEKDKNSAAVNSIINLAIVCTIYLIAIICIKLNLSNVVIWLDVIAVLLGAFLPFVIKGKFNKGIINFPHLVERFELLTIITFGEGIVGMTHFFDTSKFSFIPILTFVVFITMFGAYVIQIHNLMNHHREERSLRLMFSHYFIVISINLITVCFELIHGGTINHLLVCELVITCLIVFYTAIMMNYKYYKDGVKLSKKDIVIMILSAIIGSTIMLVAIDSIYGFLIGTLIITVLNFFVLLNKQRKYIN